ncbi:MAG: hypothetical protein JSU65_10255 [Candidatus Zixiibacteriota bacterium]|nr:MAG: hypothetical protein JSU65_10255 [candidate division Zixibacteria bacterium]
MNHLQRTMWAVLAAVLVVAIPQLGLADSTTVSETSPESTIYTFYPQTASFWTGYVRRSVPLIGSTTYSRYDGSIRVGYIGNILDPDYTYRGWAKFDITGLPDNACVESVELVGYCYDASSDPHTLKVNRLTIDPVTYSSTSGLFSAIYNTNYVQCSSCMRSTGSHTVVLSSLARSDLESATSRNWFAVGLQEYSDNDDPGRWYGYGTGNRPYLRVTASTPPTSAPGTPTVSVAQPCSLQAYTVYWSSVSGATSYRLYENSSLIWEGSGTSVPMNNSPGTYNYYVRAGNSCGYGPPSGTRVVQVRSTPAPPTGPTVSPPDPCATTSYQISWGSVSGATYYRLYENGGIVYQGSSTYRDFSHGSGTFDYWVQAGNDCGLGGSSDTLSVPLDQVPNPPSTPAASPPDPCEGQSYEIYWPPVSGATGYRLYENSILIYEGPSTSQFYSRGPATFSYWVEAGNSCGWGTKSGTLQVQVTGTPAAPAKPTATPPDPCEGEQYTVQWNPVSGATSYRLYENGGIVYQGPSLQETFSHGAGSYDYWVTAGNQCGYGGPSGTKQVQVLAGPSPPSTVLAHMAPCADSSYKVWWSRVSGATSYRLFENGGLIWEGSDTVRVLSHSSGTYAYYVQAAVGSCYGSSSAVAHVEIQMDVPPIPSAPNVSDPSPCAGVQYTLNWATVAGATGYVLYENGVPIWSGSGGMLIPVTRPAGTYAYSVRSVNDCGKSDYGPETVVHVVGTPAAPAAPSSSDTIPCEDSTYTISWSPVGGATTYRLSENAVQIYEGPNIQVSLSNDTGSYNYEVIAGNQCGWSSSSSARSVSVIVCCCSGPTGNVDGDILNVIDIGDLTTLITYLFIPPFPVPPCMEEANIDGTTDGVVDMGDLTALISYLFIPPFPAPEVCQKPL